ncbi:DUF6463 family protein [Myceligenerans crystallogenes]|uniref:DUF6463 family protein n=1 Tax=Myceligenerans crystallogenes TaxID=316335 RepID=A0ABN2NA87_9MICO
METTGNTVEVKAPGSGLTRAAGIALLVIAVLHVVFTMSPYWPGWIAGELRNGGATIESVAAFWSQPGGFWALLVILGLLTIRAANQGDLLPAYVGWILLGWIVLCMIIVGPASGFTTGLVPAALLIAAALRDRSGR